MTLEQQVDKPKSGKIIFDMLSEIVSRADVKGILNIGDSFLDTLARNRLITKVEYWDEEGIRHVGYCYKDLIKVYAAHQLLNGNKAATKDSRFIVNDLKRKTARIGWEQEHITPVNQAISDWIESKPQDLSS